MELAIGSFSSKRIFPLQFSRHQGTRLIHPTHTSRASPSANATAQASSEIPRPAAFAATFVVSFLSDTVVSPFQFLRRGRYDPRFGALMRELRKKEKARSPACADDRASYSET
jgi:hypothetical protein